MLTYSPLQVPHRSYFTFQPWMLEPGHLDNLSPRGRAYFEEFIGVYQEFWKEGGKDATFGKG